MDWQRHLYRSLNSSQQQAAVKGLSLCPADTCYSLPKPSITPFPPSRNHFWAGVRARVRVWTEFRAGVRIIVKAGVEVGVEVRAEVRVGAKVEVGVWVEGMMRD